jgi:putative mRNA 3-end processing factor
LSSMGSILDHFMALTPQGLYCPLGDFYIDPLHPVKKALITHGHADHARPGHQAVMATRQTLDIMALRYGKDYCTQEQAIPFGEKIRLKNITVTFVPAGHVLGSAQIILETAQHRLVVTGDYKRGQDATCQCFELVPCDALITEATFGLPVFTHPEPEEEIRKLLTSVKLFPDKPHLVGAYALGKAQRVISLIRKAGYDEPLYIHGALQKLCDYYQSQGINLGELIHITAEQRKHAQGRIVLCPPGALSDTWSRGFGDCIKSMASGWMQVRARARQRGVELPLIISDHCDWGELCLTIEETGAREIWVTHGQEDALVHWCTTKGLKAQPLHMLGYGDEEEG